MDPFPGTVPRHRILLAAGLLVSVVACAPRPTRTCWDPDSVSIPPGPDLSRDTASSRGALVVETARTGFQEGPVSQRYRFYLYDEGGRLLNEYLNDLQSPVDLAPGRYVVVSQVGPRYKRVQVILERNRTTVVHLRDFERAPEAY